MWTTTTKITRASLTSVNNTQFFVQTNTTLDENDLSKAANCGFLNCGEFFYKILPLKKTGTGMLISEDIFWVEIWVCLSQVMTVHLGKGS